MDHDRPGDEPLGDDDSEVSCPMPCTSCTGPGGCEDCLDCLYWPEAFDSSRQPAAAIPGPLSPVRIDQLGRARSRLGIGQRVGLVVRRARGDRGLSTRSLATELGWHHSTLTRAEGDAGRLTLHKADGLLRHLGYRIAVVPDSGAPATELGEPPDETWGSSDLLARDGQGRRLPPYATTTWNSIVDRRLWSRIVKHEAEWTWHRPRGRP